MRDAQRIQPTSHVAREVQVSVVAVLALVLDVMVGFAYKISTDYFKINPIISYTSL